ncbi:DUF1599 domain-containing protein [Blattabacterium cuenoti]|uniref:DUF1599 domain-containing protein n=1 Tax=Blattabacterium cuenoti TaxID=1653831 RepID=UPI00163D2D45|nr:DUF1599 domain-containing protein [Blattabacterium cuenoti]
MHFLSIEIFLKKCKKIFLEKLKNYGSSWIALNKYSMIDQILIKIIRIKNISSKGYYSVKEESIIDTYIDIINYLIIALIKIDLKNEQNISNNDKIIDLYNKKIKKIFNSKKNIVFYKKFNIENIIKEIFYMKKKINNFNNNQLKNNYFKILIKILSHYNNIHKNLEKF